MANLDRSFPRGLQPTGLVAILGGIDGPNRLVEAVISECLIFDRDLAVHNTFGEVLPSGDVLRVAVTAAWGATFRVASLFIAWAWMHVVHIIMNRLLKNRVEAFLLDLTMIVISYSFGCYRCVCACALKA